MMIYSEVAGRKRTEGERKKTASGRVVLTLPEALYG